MSTFAVDPSLLVGTTHLEVAPERADLIMQASDVLAELGITQGEANAVSIIEGPVSQDSTYHPANRIVELKFDRPQVAAAYLGRLSTLEKGL